MIHVLNLGTAKMLGSISNAVVDSLHSVGKECRVFCKTINNPNSFDLPYSDINIIIRGDHIIPNQSNVNILIQAEQSEIYLKELKEVKHKKWTRILSGFTEIDIGENSVYFPLGYSKHFDTSIREDETIDFYFFGSISSRRKCFIEKHNVLYKNLFGTERDKLIMSSRFNININYQSNYLFPSLRALLVMCKGKIFLQEICKGGYGIYKNYVINFTEDTFLDVVEQWKNKNKREEYATYVRDELINKHKFEDNFFNLVKDLL